MSLDTTLHLTKVFPLTGKVSISVAVVDTVTLPKNILGLIEPVDELPLLKESPLAQ